MSFFNPGFIEDLGKDLIRHRIEKQVHKKIDALTASFLGSKAGKLAGQDPDEIEMARSQLKDIIPEKISGIMAEMRNHDCDCRLRTEKNLHQEFEWQLARSALAQERLSMLIRTKYMETAEKLLLELRIFTATNALAFTLLGIAAWRKRDAGLQLLPPALALPGATAITAWLYSFNQDWLHTILFSDYTGFWYFAWLAIIFAMLSDILLNRARIINRMLNMLFGVVAASLPS